MHSVLIFLRAQPCLTLSNTCQCTDCRQSVQLFDYDEASYDGPLDFVGDGSTSERLVVVANRLPVTCSKDQHGHWQLQVKTHKLCCDEASRCMDL